MTDTTDPEAFYDEYGEREWDRLERDFFHRLEWEGTVEYLDRYLPESGHVLDVGGAAGRYTVWLAEQGYDVTLVDLSAEQLDIAREQVGERDLGDRVTVEKGDVRDLAFDADEFDATLCLGGPVSHVVDEAERETAVAELRRVTRTGGPVFVSVMGLLSAVVNTVDHTGRERFDGSAADYPILSQLVDTGDYTGELCAEHGVEPVMADCHFFRADELESLLESGGLAVETLAALEGVASTRRDEFDGLGDDRRRVVREVNDALREDRSVVDLSSHMLAVARVP
ncbi:bifunctional 2-polyprenyl-6-hydroxyphenol methylase/3-demethylubiquinol 3-O-methyltransferase UbiG [Haloarchaeobius sp. FL176]|uniref:class I SAM-dependent methyltransferase n=1 Tax=Haloarchaeobius sp. FL176 TaxID=2967129 RepID=UPI0021497DEA|nr:class I SAM-dependent methyltransferase [Haloarchaeobius sp. FL176]